jgi:hypothetical protein
VKTNLIEDSSGNLIEYREGMDLGNSTKSRGKHIEIARCILVQQVILAKKHAGIAPSWMTTALGHLQAVTP